MSTPTHTLSFDVWPLNGDGHQWIPVIDGVSLVDLVTEFESHMDYDALGGYAGPGVDQIRAGNLESHLLAGRGAYPGDGVVALLGCTCGELGCWPLYAHVTVAGGQVVWDQFAQPFRPGRDYSDFGPFVFDEAQYRDAVAGLVVVASV